MQRATSIIITSRPHNCIELLIYSKLALKVDYETEIFNPPMLLINARLYNSWS